jgi:cytochrome c peroxidase
MGSEQSGDAKIPDGSQADDGQDVHPDDGSSAMPDTETFLWKLPEGFPSPVLPDENPMSDAKVELGRRLFYDKRLSHNETQACASCHLQELAFSDGRATGLGSTGESHTRSSPSIVNLAYATSLTWANPLFAIGVLPEPLERQTQIPMYGDSPTELGLKSQSELTTRLADVELYRDMFAEAFPADLEPVNALNVGRALAAFERILISGDSRYDHFIQGEKSALTESEQRGLSLFTSDRLECSSCHSGFNLTEHVQWQGKSTIELVYRNTGLYNIDGSGAYPEPNTGAFNVTMNPDDMGKFRVPSLRNIAVTAPYMHDGSINTLSEVIDHYAVGGRTIASGQNAGVGRDNPLKDARIHGFEITEAERLDLIAFLGSLTDEDFLTNPAFADPWAQE